MQANTKTLFLIFAVLLLMIGAVIWLKPHHSHLLPESNTSETASSLTIYFCKSRGSTIVTASVSRPLPLQKSNQALLATAVSGLLQGPTAEEKQQGYFSEIPAGTRLNAVQNYPNRLVIDLSADYTSGGGSNSMIQRYRQLAKTILATPQKKPVYVEVGGKLLEVLGGEGLQIHEPIIHDDNLNP